MAFSTILRRSALRAAPLAAEVFGFQRHAQPAAAFSSVKRAFLSPQLRVAANSSNRHFSSSVSSSDKKLVEVLQSEIDVVEQSEDYGKDVEVPGDFSFKIEDHVGEQTVTLTREYGSETITVEVSMPSLVTGEEEEDEDQDQGDEQAGNQSSVPLFVTVAKKNGLVLEFDCTAFPDEISINNLLLKNPETEDQLAYEGPDFLDLDENLRKGFYKYLEIRGIKPTMTSFLHEYMIEKDNREYLRWLKNVKKFVEA